MPSGKIGTENSVVLTAGGIVLGGAAAISKSKVFQPSGGIVFAGSAALAKSKAFAPSGGAGFGGAAATEFVSTAPPAGASGGGIWPQRPPALAKPSRPEDDEEALIAMIALL